MLRLYNYLLFRIYRFYIDKMKEKEAVLFSVTAASTVIIYFFLFNIYSWLNYLDFLPALPNKYFIFGSMIFLGVMNYFLLVRHKKFLDYEFKKDLKGGIAILLLIIVILFSTIAEGHLNRAKIFNETSLTFIENSIL